jgi:sulfate adenylyltransferase subunit 2
MMQMQNLGDLEGRSVSILREANTQFKKIAVLWSMGKDSTAVLSLIRKAFMKRVPFPVIHIDNGIDFPESYSFRDSLTEKWNLELIVAESRIKKELSGFSCCGANKTDALRKVMDDYGFDAMVVSIRRDEHGIRAKERFFSPRDSSFKWNYKNQKEELWGNYATLSGSDSHMRVHPLLEWNEIDVWNYTKRERIPVNPLYFARDGLRYRSLGCTHCTVPIESSASTVDGIIKELETTKSEERSGRQQDKEKAYAMEKLRALGYM